MIGGERPALVEPSETLEGVLEEGMKLIMSHCLASGVAGLSMSFPSLSCFALQYVGGMITQAGC